MSRARSKKTGTQKNKPSVGDELIRGLTAFRDALRDEADLETRFTVRTVSLDFRPREYSAKDIRALRDRLRVSQAVFASLIGVSAKTVQAWEQGQPVPAIARRLFEAIERDPTPWEDLLRAASTGQRRRPA